MSKKLGTVQATDRGFAFIEFRDRSGRACSLQQSSLADREPPGTSAVWLGVEKERMHLDVEQAKALVAELKAWLKTGRFIA